jgi:hypothetical protein
VFGKGLFFGTAAVNTSFLFKLLDSFALSEFSILGRCRSTAEIPPSLIWARRRVLHKATPAA